MIFNFHPLAFQELDEAINAYEAKFLGLGLEFAKEVYSSIQRIIQFPSAWTMISHRCRRILLQRFPFAIIYSKEGHEILILAIMQLNRKPEYWKNRL